LTRIYEKDQEAFLSRFTKENILRELKEHGVFTSTYRLVDNGTPTYVNMKITRMRERRKPHYTRRQHRRLLHEAEGTARPRSKKNGTQ
jgi:hypothetical protein